jgi:hypothetical protein
MYSKSVCSVFGAKDSEVVVKAVPIAIERGQDFILFSVPFAESGLEGLPALLSQRRRLK